MKLTAFRHWRESRLQKYPDSVLCDECLAGNEDAWVALLSRYQNLIYSIPFKFRLDEDEAADIFQSVVLDLYTGLRDLRDREKLKSWLIAVTRHRCIRYRHNHHDGPLSAEEQDAALAALQDPDTEPEKWLLEVEEESQVREAIASLPRRCREIILWLFYSEPTPHYAELALWLGVARNSVGFIRERCLQKLRAQLEKEGFAGNGCERIAVGANQSAGCGRGPVADGRRHE